MQVAPGVELVRYNDLGNGDIQVQVAINGSLAPMIDDHKSSRERYRSDEAYFAWIGRTAEVLIYIYGDARNPRTEDQILGKQQEGF